MSWTSLGSRFELQPSLYAADFRRLGKQIEDLSAAGAQAFHFDVGDGQFVEPVTIGPIVLESIAPDIHAAGGVIDCHLMIVAPWRHFPAFAAAGADSVTFHVEACPELAQVASQAREYGMAVGVALNPETAVEAAVEQIVTAEPDLVLCMSIHPGYSGQAFLRETPSRIAELRAALPSHVPIQVDGGIDEENIDVVIAAGASLLVSGSAIFAAPNGPARGFSKIKAAAEAAWHTKHPGS